MLWSLLLSASAEAVAFSAADIAPALSTVGSIGFAVWYAVHVTTKTIPDLLAAHKAERAELLTELRTARLESTEARLQFAKWIERREPHGP